MKLNKKQRKILRSTLAALEEMARTAKNQASERVEGDPRTGGSVETVFASVLEMEALLRAIRKNLTIAIGATTTLDLIDAVRRSQAQTPKSVS